MLQAARVRATRTQPYLAIALHSLQVVAAPGLGTFAVDRAWRLYVDPALDRERQTDTLQETLINVTAAWPAVCAAHHDTPYPTFLLALCHAARRTQGGR